MVGPDDKMVSMHAVDILLARLDPESARRADSALSGLLGERGERAPLDGLSQLALQQLLWERLGRTSAGPESEDHEVVWALGDFFALAGLDRYAAICRDPRTHEVLALWHRDPDAAAGAAARAQQASGIVPLEAGGFAFGDVLGPVEGRAFDGASRFLEDGVASGALDPELRGFRAAARRRVERYLTTPTADFGGEPPRTAVWRERAEAWMASFRDVPAPFWDRAMPHVHELPAVPERVALSLAPAVALLEAVGTGVTLTDAGYLPTRLVAGLDERFGWSQEYSLSRPRGETDLPPLRFLHEHLRAQRLLTRRGRHLTVSTAGRDALADPAVLWASVTAPAPRWRAGFEHDALAVLAIAQLRDPRLTGEQLLDEMVYVLGGKWRAEGGGSLEEGARWVQLEWYRVGLVLGWYDGRGRSTEWRLSGFGRVAAACVFRAVSTAPRR